MKKVLTNLLKAGLGILIITLLMYKVGFSQIYETILDMNPWFIPIAFCGYIISFFAGAYNIKIIVDATGHPIPYLKQLRYFLLSWAFGFIAPSKIGELSLVYFLNKDGVPLGKAFAATVLDKIITVFVLIIIMGSGIFIFFDANTAIRIMLIIIAAFVLGVFLLLSARVRGLIKKYILRKYSEKFKGFSSTLIDILKKQKRVVAMNIAITAVKWLILSAIITTLFRAFGQNVNILLVLIICSATSLISSIPITVSGLGIRESLAVYLYGIIMVPAATTASVYLIIMAMTYTLSFTIMMMLRHDDIKK